MNQRGVTLAELMVTTVIISVGIVGGMSAFKYIGSAIRNSRGKTLATNLAQEKIESLKNLTYYQLLLTTATATDNHPNPTVTYDTSNYPPENITIGNVNFVRYTYVTLAQMVSNQVSAVGYTFTDTGLKQIQVYVVWQDGKQWKEFSLTNLLENPNVNPLDSRITGTIDISGGSNPPLAGAQVFTEQNPNYQGVTDSNGNFSFQVAHGSYTVRVTTTSYFDTVTSLLSATAGNTVSAGTIYMQAIGSGTVTGTAWYNPNLVISQVVASTNTQVATDRAHGNKCATSQDLEYVELFNPTTYQINIINPTTPGPPWTSQGASVENIKINTQYGTSNNTDIMNSHTANIYISSYVTAGGYYLIANYPSFVANGQWVAADASYGNNNGCGFANSDMIANYKCGSVQITNANGNSIDQVCWNGPVNSGSPSLACTVANLAGATQYCNGSQIPTDSTCGMNAGGGANCQSPTNNAWQGNELVRFSSPTVIDTVTYGAAYNSQNNAADFAYPPYPMPPAPQTTGLILTPHNTASTAVVNGIIVSTPLVIAGIPAVGAYVSASDGYSGSTQAYATSIANQWGQLQTYAQFTLPGIATSPSSGWNVNIATATGPTSNQIVYYAQISTVVIKQNISTGVPNGATVPAWTATNDSTIILTSQTLNGFIRGKVTDISGNPISGIQITAAGVTMTTGSNGMYFMSVSSGSISVTANSKVPPSQPYISQTNSAAINTGQMTQQDFQLSQGGSITGYVTSGTSPVPNVLVAALSGGNQAGTGTSGTDGNFTIPNLSSGTYTIQPALGGAQTSSPLSTSVSLNSSSVFSTTFTVGGFPGTLTGNVTYNNAAVTSGALILASSIMISNPPPAIYAATSPALTNTIFAVSSKADGTYQLPLTGPNTYYIGVYVPTVAGTTVSVTTKTYSSIFVSPGVTQIQNLSLP